MLELRQTESRQPMQKALAAMSKVASGKTVATMISLKMVRTIQTRQTRLLIRDLDDDDGESVEPNLIQLKAKPTLDEDEIDETVVMDETIRTPKLTMPNIQVSTVQKVRLSWIWKKCWYSSLSQTCHIWRWTSQWWAQSWPCPVIMSAATVRVIPTKYCRGHRRDIGLEHSNKEHLVWSSRFRNRRLARQRWRQ